MIFTPFFYPPAEVGPGGGGYIGPAGGAAAGSSLPWGVSEAVVGWVGGGGAAFHSRSGSDGMGIFVGISGYTY